MNSATITHDTSPTLPVLLLTIAITVAISVFLLGAFQLQDVQELPSTTVVDANKIPADYASLETYLISAGDPDLTRNGESLLHQAVTRKDMESIRLLAATGAALNVRDDSSFTPLMYAIAIGDENLVRLLLQLGANPLIADNEGYTAYHYAATRHQKRLLDILVKLLPPPEGLRTDNGLTINEVGCLSRAKPDAKYLSVCLQGERS